MQDWRTDIKEIESLYELDFVQVLIAYRHLYLDTAKDMLSDIDWEFFGEQSCMIAEHIDQALENIHSNENT